MISAETIWSLCISQAWQVAACGLFAAGLTWLVGFRRPHLAHLAWTLVLIKALTPPVVSSPASPFSGPRRDGVEMSAVVTRFGAVNTSRSTAGATVPIDNSVHDKPFGWSQTVPAEPWGLSEWVLLGWLSGSVIVLSSVVVGYVIWMRRLLRFSLPLEPQHRRLVTDLSHRLGLRRSPRVLVTSLEIGPAAGGIFQPTLFLPVRLLDLLPEELEPVLAHELVHLRRRDPLWALLQWTAVAVWWWHPIVWWASRSVTRERERCCDAEVLGSLGYSPERYAQRLIDVLHALARPRPMPVPLTIPLTAVTRRRLVHIMRAAPFTPRPPRSNLLIAGVLALILLPGGRFTAQAVSQNRQSEQTPKASQAAVDQSTADPVQAEQATIDPPELLYLTWQPNDRKSNGEQIDLAFWLPDGTLVSEESIRIHRAFPANPNFSFKVHNRREQDRRQELHPLVMVFRFDDSLKNSYVMPTVITEKGQRDRMGTGMFSRGRPLVLSASAPRRDVIDRWPQSISLEIKYPIEDPQLIKTITEMPDDVVQVAEGVTWYFDPSRAAESDPVARRLRPAPNKTAAVLQQIRDGSLDLIEYDARPYLRASGERLSSVYAQTIERDGQMHNIDVWAPFNDKDEIERVEFTRQRFARARIDYVKLRLDLLPD